jgi:hypothetical protein
LGGVVLVGVGGGRGKSVCVFEVEAQIETGAR